MIIFDVLQPRLYNLNEEEEEEEEEDVEDADEATRDEIIDQLEILIEWERRRQIHYSYTWCTRHYYFTLFITHTFNT